MKNLRNYNKLYLFLVLLWTGFSLCFCAKFFIDIKQQFYLSKYLFDFYRMSNTGAAFSMFKGSNLLLAYLAAAISVGVLVFVLKKYKTLSTLELTALSVFLSGVLSNMFERFYYGHVIDYIRLGFIAFPVFNLADIFINAGVILIVLSVLFSKRSSDE